MSYLRKQMQYLKFDRRLLEINMKSGTITEEEYKNHLSQLENDEAKSETINLEGDSAPSEDPSTEVQAPSTEVTPPSPVAPVTPTNSDPFGSGY